MSAVGAQLSFTEFEWLASLHGQQRISDAGAKLLRTLVKRGLAEDALLPAAMLILALEESAAGANR